MKGHAKGKGGRRPGCVALLTAASLGLAFGGGVARAEADLFDLPIESLMQVRVSVASPFSESVMDSPSSVAVLTPEDWQKRGARSLEEALEQVPSVVSYAAPGGSSMFAIRGYANDLSSRGTATLLDGVPINNFSYATAVYNLPFVPLSLLERIEIIRGPGSTLYGSDAFHGVISLNTWDTEREARRAQVSAGSFDDGVLSASASGHLSSAWRVSGGAAFTHHGDRDTRYDYTNSSTGELRVGTRDYHEHDETGFLHLQSGNALDGLWRLGLYSDNYKSDGFPGIGTQFYQPLSAALSSNSLDFAGARDTMGQTSGFRLAQLQHQRGLGENYSLDVRLFRWESDQTWILDASEYPTIVTTMSSVTLPCRTSPTETGVSPLYCPHTLYQGTADRRQGVHALLRSEAAGNTQWAIGAGSDWLEVLDAPLRRIGTNGQVYSIAEAPFSGADRRVDHVLLQGRTDLQPFSLVYGVRWDDYSDIGSATSPRLGVFYKPGTHWNSKLLYSHAFRAPTAGEQYGTGALQLPGIDLKPETIDTLELVGQYARGRHETELVWFHSRWQEGIVLVPVGLGANQYRNIDDSHSIGVELVHRRVRRDWRFEGNLSWTASENKSAAIDYVAFPQWIANFGFGRTLGNGWSAWLNERVMLNLAVGDAISLPVPPEAPDYYRTDLHLDWLRGKARWGFDIRNLFDRGNVMPSLFNASGGLPEEGVSARVSVELTL